ncbi:MAG: ABC transporter permease [Coriobacteriia bacterium]|nr:ABC transporter permease [Coriobacteriia bacterium]
MPSRAANTEVRSARRPGVHAVGMTGAVLGLVSLVALPFATFRSSRIQTGDDLSALASLGPWWLGAIAAVWVALVVLSLGNDRREAASAARGLLGAVAPLGTLMLSAVAAERLLADGPEFARVSIGMGAWACMIAGYMVVLASRRELADRRALAAVLGALAPVGIVVLLASGTLANLGMLKEYASQSERFWAEVGAHVLFAAVSMAIAIVAGVSLGVLAFRRPPLKRPVFAVVSVFQTIPGLAMVGLLFAPLSWLGANVALFERLGVGGLGWAPVILALTLYALLAVVRNTYAGLEGVPPATVDAALGMGMTEWQVMRRVRIPLAMPALLGGVRTSTVQTVGNATLGAFVAAGTLGLFVFGGLSQQASDLIMLASLAIVAMALLADGALRAAQRLLLPARTSAEGTCDR